jgi:large subunit ribosomal protein L24
MATLKIKKGDTVIVLAGDNKGDKGRVLEILHKDGKAIVEGVNIVSKSTKPNAKAPQGGIIKKEAPIDLSNLAVVDPKSGKPTRVGFRFNEDGKKVRYSKKTGEEIK